MSKIKFVERKISEARTEIVALSSDRYEIERAMHPSMRDAEFEIAKYFQMQTAGMGYAVGDMERTGQGVDNSELSKDDLLRIADLARWKRECLSKARGVTLDHYVFGFDFDSIAYQRCLSVEMVLALYLEGLKKYCEIRGWM